MLWVGGNGFAQQGFSCLDVALFHRRQTQSVQQQCTFGLGHRHIWQGIAALGTTGQNQVVFGGEQIPILTQCVLDQPL